MLSEILAQVYESMTAKATAKTTTKVAKRIAKPKKAAKKTTSTKPPAKNNTNLVDAKLYNKMVHQISELDAMLWTLKLAKNPYFRWDSGDARFNSLMELSEIHQPRLKNLLKKFTVKQVQELFSLVFGVVGSAKNIPDVAEKLSGRYDLQSSDEEED